jgi:hypothetical protein
LHRPRHSINDDTVEKIEKTACVRAMLLDAARRKLARAEQEKTRT